MRQRWRWLAIGAALLGFGAWVRRQPVGTRSLLVGGHQFAIHPACVALGWRQIYGTWPRDPRVWVAFAIHDIGYWGLPNMDGPEGVAHPLRGANLMGRWFDRDQPIVWASEWWRFVACHSRTAADRLGLPTSPLMRPDKLATHLCPRPLLALLYWLSGEWVEYRDRWVATRRYPGEATDGVWAYTGHIQANFGRFHDPAAHAGGLHMGG